MFFRYNLFGMLWALFILVLTLLPGSNMPKTTILSFDKIAHFGIFCMLFLLLAVGFTKQYTFRPLKKKPVEFAFALSVAYGVVIEIIQIFIPGRSFELLDVVANSIGVGLGLGVFYIIYRS